MVYKMKLLAAVRGKLGDVAAAVTRFPGTFLILLALAVLMSVSIETNNDYDTEMLSLAFAAFCFLTAQVLSERAGGKLPIRLLLYAAAAALAAGHYLLIRGAADIDTVIAVNTATGVFALFIAFIWIPSFKGNADFNVVFLSVFKALFTAAFYTGILFGGISLILVAVDTLLFNLGDTFFEHTATYIWLVWAPMLFLSLVPVFLKDDPENEKVKKASAYPKFLEVVLSYILVPLASVYTLVLLLYIIKTAAAGSWNDNLLEPLLLSYCIAVLILYILVSRLDNRFTLFFRKFFPIFLTFIAFFQIVSSAITVSALGIVHGRYFVLMFGLYAVICGILLFMLPVRKNGITAVLAVCFALVCVLPFAGAFPVSITSQTSVLRNTLERNNMLSGDTVTPNPDIPEDDKIAVSSSVLYLSNIGRGNLPSYIPADYANYDVFEKAFGFTPEHAFRPGVQTEKYYELNRGEPFSVAGYDYMSLIDFGLPDSRAGAEYGKAETGDSTYTVSIDIKGMTGTLKIMDNGGNELISVPVEELFEKISLVTPSSEKGVVTAEMMTFDYESDAVRLRIIVNNASIYSSSFETSSWLSGFLLFSLK